MHLLNNIFTPPKYLEMPAYGFDISDRSLKFIEFIRTSEGIRLGNYGRKALPSGVINSGEVKKPGELIDFLRKSFKGLEIKEIIASLPEERAYVSIMKLPLMKKKQARQAVEAEFSEYIPISLQEAAFDFEIISEDESLKQMDIKLVAMPLSVVSAYRDVFRNAGLEPLAFEMETMALARAVVWEGSSDSVMIVDFGRTRTSFIIVAGGHTRFSSTISVSGEGIDSAIAKEFNITVFEAERMKKEKGMLRFRKNEKLYNAILPSVSAIKEEISRQLVFWKERSGNEKPVGRIILCGGGATLRGFAEYLSYELQMPVNLANVWVNTFSYDEYIPDIDFNESLFYSTAAGLALRSLNQYL